MLLFGFSKSLAWAIASRGICGLFNGTLSRLDLTPYNISGPLAELTQCPDAIGNAGVARTAGAEREPLIKPKGTERNRFNSKTATTCCIAGIV